MSDHKRGRIHLCGNCGRVTKRDLDRHYCPVTAWDISFNKSADKCHFYIASEDPDMTRRWKDVRRRDEDVF